MTKSDELVRDWEWAVANGAKMPLEQYVANRYSGYETICLRCGIQPMPMAEWIQA